MSANLYGKWDTPDVDPIVHWTPSRLAYLEALFTHPKLPSDIIHALVRPHTIQRLTNNYLRQLRGKPNLFIHWPTDQRRSYQALYRPRHLSLTSKASDILTEHGTATPQQVRWYQARLSAERPTEYEHDLASSVLVGLIHYTVKNRGLEYVSWAEILAKAPEEIKALHNPLELSVEITHELAKEPVTTILPDGLFGIGYGEGFRFFANEWERAPKTKNPESLKTFAKSLLRKLLGYEDILERGLYHSQFGIPWRNFYVLLNFQRATQVEPTLALIRERIKPKHQKRFLVKAFPEFIDYERTPPPSLDPLATPWKTTEGEFDLSKP